MTRAEYGYCECGHSKALHLRYCAMDSPEACRGALGTCDCEKFVNQESKAVNEVDHV